MTIPTCPKCQTPQHVVLRRQFASNGHLQFLWWCHRCDNRNIGNTPFIKKAVLEEWRRVGKLKVQHLNEIPLLADYRVGKCEVCGKLGVEEHHWLPQCFSELVSDFNKWPKGLLCTECHEKWHEIVTHYMSGRGKTELGKRAKEIVKR